MRRWTAHRPSADGVRPRAGAHGGTGGRSGPGWATTALAAMIVTVLAGATAVAARDASWPIRHSADARAGKTSAEAPPAASDRVDAAAPRGSGQRGTSTRAVTPAATGHGSPAGSSDSRSSDAGRSAGSAGRSTRATGSRIVLDAARPAVTARLPGRAVRLVEPDVLARATSAVTPAEVSRLRRRLHGATIALADTATITVAGRQVHAIGVDPANFARFTPGVTASSRPLWQRIVAGDLAVSFPVARAARLPLGGLTRVGTDPRRTVAARVGAFAAFGLPGVDAVTSPTTAARLGAAARRVVLVSAPGHDPAEVSRVLRAVVGPTLEVDALHTTRPATTVLRTGWSGTWRSLYQRAAVTCPGLPWQVLAAIGTIESGNGRDVGPSSAGALGPMQFLPSTWASYGVDADRDGRADIMSPVDAVYSAARYLCDNGAGRGRAALAGAIYAYNHADWYVADVLGLAARIA